MATMVSIDGEVVAGKDARVSVFDRGFLFGDSIYEVMRTSAGHPVDRDRHLERLVRSAASLAIDAPPSERLGAWLDAVVAATGEAECYLRLIVTRGVGPIGLDVALAEGAHTVIIAAPLSLPAPELYRHGASVAVVGVERTSRRALDPAVKSGNYLNNILALAEARRRGAYEAVLLNPDGNVAEGSTSNVFAVRGGRLVTPALDCGLLPGITRRRVIELAVALGVEVIEGIVTADQLRGADEAFLTSSLRGVLPLARIDDRSLTAPGPVTAALMAAYDAFLASEAKGGGRSHG
jgi:branched-chain amino acid aminotransferase